MESQSTHKVSLDLIRILRKPREPESRDCNAKGRSTQEMKRHKYLQMAADGIKQCFISI